MAPQWITDGEAAGLSAPLSRQIALLWDMLADGLVELGEQDTLDLLQDLFAASADAPRHGDYTVVEARLQALEDERIGRLLHAGLAWFQLLNAAEKQEIVRANRARMGAFGGAVAAPPDSLDQAVAALAAAGCSAPEAAAAVGRLDVQPTLTAHPTEADRRLVRDRLQRIDTLLERLRDEALTVPERRDTCQALRNETVLLLRTDPVRAEKPAVEAEVAYGLSHLAGPIWDGVPAFYRMVGRALEGHYCGVPSIPVFLRFRSWIGGDRDGNPNVTPAVTRETLETHRRAALDGHVNELATLCAELSLSDRFGTASPELNDSVAADLARVALDDATKRRFAHAPYQMKIACMIARIRAERERADDADESRVDYRACDYVADLECMSRSLAETGLEAVARRGRLADTLALARTFGFHLAALDIRQHSQVHAAAVAAILNAEGVADDYLDRPEDERVKILAEALARPQAILSKTTAPPQAAGEVLDALRVARAAAQREPNSIGSYVISMTHGASDVLEVLLLAREAGLWRTDGTRGHAPIDIVPLYETIVDLAGAGERLAALYAHPAYRAQLAGRGNFQEVMIGYSDSNKDGGFWMANRRLQHAQEEVVRVSRQHGVAFRLFHGRGGTVERGGGLSNQEMLAAAPALHNGRLRFTEQGEVISFRYGSRDLAVRHLEQVTQALLRATGCSQEARDALSEAEAATFDALGERAMHAYRCLIEDEAFWPWYTATTPIRLIGRLPIASRPVSRSGGKLRFDEVRAIPWVFAWSQTRYAVPGWFGLGSALESGGPDMEALRALYEKSAFFRHVVRNAERELARARPAIARLYASAAARPGARIHRIIEADFHGTRRAVLTLTGQNGLLDDQPVLRDIVAFRNRFADLLHLLQLEVMRRRRTGATGAPDEEDWMSFLSIEAIAAALESTG